MQVKKEKNSTKTKYFSLVICMDYLLVIIYLLTPLVIQTTLGRKDLGSIAQPQVDVPEILRFALDDITRVSTSFIFSPLERGRGV